MPKSQFTKEMEAFVRANYMDLPASEMSRVLGIAAGIICRNMRRLGLKTPKEVSRKWAASKLKGRTRATAKQDEFIKAHALTMPLKRMARTLGVGDTLVKLRMKHLGIVVPQELRDKWAEQSRLKKGNVPPNKGKKQVEYMSAESIERSKATRFKKGNIPANAFEKDGVITIRNDKRGVPYKHIRIALGEWEYLHIYNWKTANGQVPDGHVVAFKDGDTLNPDISNLELITMGENMLRNSGTMNLPDGMISVYLAPRDRELRKEILKHPELIELKRQQILLQREIKSKS
ncbi:MULTISPECIES: HNH endonuclease signature motif containing protein [Olivibacter]|uniref:HNH endonuclease signature motif containing protein n=1 Tax=Olivibacter jilunii TaxID=985016 RepID=A0ABW6B3G1_9SPHI